MESLPVVLAKVLLDLGSTRWQNRSFPNTLVLAEGFIVAKRRRGIGAWREHLLSTRERVGSCGWT
jgi:hypothetical protein